MSGEFCDTNVIVYAYDITAGTKQTQASQLLAGLWESGTGVLSVQVLQEAFVTLTRKLASPLTGSDARAIVSDLATWRIVEPTSGDVIDAIDAALRWQLAFWDALIVTAARKAGAQVLWSEDLNDGQAFGDTVVRNPFR